MKRMFLFAILLLIFLSINNSIQAQLSKNSISGYIKDASTGEPLCGVNVFLSGTYWGSSTDNEGHFIVEAIIPGNYEIVSSMVGYKPEYATLVVKENRHTKVDFFLKETVYKMKDVTVKAERPEEWFDQLELFKKYFLGRRNLVSDCIIKNETEINFTENDTMFYAHCKNPIHVYNYALGYKLDCILFRFDYNKQTGGCNYIIKPKFTEMEQEEEDELEYWEENREDSYFGSKRHFLVSLVNDELVDGEFLLVWAITKPHMLSNHAKSKILYHSDKTLRALLDSTVKLDSSTNDLTITSSSQWMANFYGWMSAFDLPNGSVTLDRYGYPKQLLAINVMGAWAKYGVADMLPRFYELKFTNE